MAISRVAESSQRSDQWVRLLCALFFLSGFPALIYQLTWQRTLFRIFGVNIESVTIVVTAFMLGLGLGSLAGGWVSKRRDIPLLPLLALIELLTAVFGIVSLTIFDKVGEVTSGIGLMGTAAITLGLVLLPTLLMGATLPVLVGHLVRHDRNIGNAVGLLYYVNTLGAGAACLVAAALLFPFLGTRGSIYVAVALNGVVAIGALAIYWTTLTRAEQTVSGTTTLSSRARHPAIGYGSALGLAAMGGLISLSFEIFFFRTVSFSSGSSATAFAVTLGAFLVGLASGSRRAGEDCRTLNASALARRPINAAFIASLLGLLFLPLLVHLAWLERGVLALIVLMVYLIGRFWGSLLPYLAELSFPPDSSAGMYTAILYLANILGASAGSILVGFVLMDYLGLAAIGATLVGAAVGFTLLLVLAVRMPRPEKMRYTALCLGTGLMAGIAIPYGSAHLLEKLQWKGASHAQPFAEALENRNGIITVTKDGTVFGHGMYDGRFNIDLTHDTNSIVRPYALSLIHPAPHKVLMIGLSTGSWAQVIAHHPDLLSLTVIEINPGYRTLVAKHPNVASLLHNPKVTIITSDGRRWLRANPEQRFDAIVSNTTWHFRSGVTNLLSAEFLEIIRRHLEPRGIFFYNTTSSDRVQRTGCVTFSHGARITNHMVVSEAPIAWSFQRWRRILQSYQIDGVPVLNSPDGREKLGQLMAWEGSLTASPLDKQRPIEPCSDILARTENQQIVTDDNMGTEWRYSLGLD